MKNKNPVICYFGVNDKTVAKNKLVLEGLKQNKIGVVDVSIHNSNTRLLYKEDTSLYSSVKRILKKFKNIKVIYRNLEDIKKCDCLYVGYPGHFDIPFAWITSRITGVPLFFNPVISLTSAFTNDISIFSHTSFKARMLLIVERWIYSLPDLIFVDTPTEVKYYSQVYRIPMHKLKILYLGADDVIYKPAAIKTKKETFDVIYYGLYIPIHGVEYIIKAASYCKDNKKIRFLFLGTGKMYQEIVNLAEKMKLTNVFFYPDARESNSITMLQQADIFLGFMQNNPTVNRAIPNKVYQGLALGKAVITADSDAVRELFTNKVNIYTCKAADPKSLAEAILTLEKDDVLRNKIADCGHELYKKHFTPKAIARELINNINSL